ncbi:conserved hypothetical protein [Leishmania major strain Friedlin]|uniref:Protein geranylgeranyltransferase type II n=1 Tax=Leishmania major TaxID=5664 RepID=Q4QAE0_LEIMA|nr:conserved hypothetical protein [Leishmania major strain Friedlin]CAG9574666.1 hypothetical_protein_-_conserved [Leishmania major strain Friedlin]CAJ05286.1 conserved hypothetical protein [Leishmania major strain Friedlin]|eukprot:XP_001683708.1 conserved hypothetical protein [Leishmania major strain Friedlin]
MARGKPHDLTASRIVFLALFASCSLTHVTIFPRYGLLVLLHQDLCAAAVHLREAPLLPSHFLSNQMEAGYTIIADAAKELDQILDAGADLYLQSIRTPGAPPIRAAFGFSQQPLESNRVACLAEIPCVAASATKFADFPVLVDRRVAAAMRAFFVHSFQRAKGPLSNVTDGVIQSPDSLDDSPHVTRAMLSDLHPTVVAVAWACIPQHEIFVSLRRRWLRETCFTIDGKADSGQNLHCAMKEFVLLDLFLSLCPKLKSLWEHRQWLCSSMCDCGFLIDGPKEGEEAALPTLQFEVQDDQLFFMAAHTHPMNYNAWHYRRLRLRTLHASPSNVCARWDRARIAIQMDSEQVIQFIREHNGDSSATSYLLFLLHEQDALDGKRDASLSEAGAVMEDPHQAAGELHNSGTKEHFNVSKEGEGGTRVGEGCPRTALAPALWRNLMAVTQTEIRRHSEKGHECMWHLRLGLIQWACTRSPQNRVRSLWSAEDELRWASTYAGLDLVDGIEALLSPVSALPYAWSESSGSSAWTSLNASRYGCQLTSLLGNASSCK